MRGTEFVVLLLCAVSLSVAVAVPMVPDENADEQALLMIEEAMDRLDAHDLAGAVDRLGKALELNPDSFDAHFWLGYVRMMSAAGNQQHREEAISHFQACLKIMPWGEAGRLARKMLVRLTGRPAGVTLLLDTQGAEGAGAQATEIVANEMCGQRLLGFSSLIARVASSPFSGARLSEAVVDTSSMALVPGRRIALAAMPEAARQDLVREVVGGIDVAPRCGWVGALGPVRSGALGSFGGGAVGLGLGARMSVSLVDPLDGRIVHTFEASSAALQYALGAVLAKELAGRLTGKLGRALGAEEATEAGIALASLAVQVQHRLTRLTSSLREREMQDELALPVEGGVWIRSAAKTPGEATGRPRLAVAPFFCPDSTTEEVAAAIAEDLASIVVADGRFSVIPAQQYAPRVKELHESEPRRPLLRCYEAISRGAKARYMATVWFDQMESGVAIKNLLGSEASVVMRGRCGIVDLDRGRTVVQRPFECQTAKREAVGDVAEKYLIAIEEVSGQVVGELAAAVRDL